MDKAVLTNKWRTVSLNYL